MSLSKWHILSLASEEFLQDVKWITVFGPSGNEAIIATNNEELYVLGANNNCCLGLGTTITPGFNPKRIESLKGTSKYCSDKDTHVLLLIDIITIAYSSGPHILALTREGAVFAWGSNGYGQLGCGSTAVYNSSPKLIEHLLCGITITKVACGGFHSLALSNEGEVGRLIVLRLLPICLCVWFLTLAVNIIRCL